MKKLACRLVLIYLSILWVSCTEQNVATPSSETEVISLFTATSLQGETAEYTPTVFMTVTPEPTESLTPLPTLDSSLRISAMQKLMQNSEDCKLPCFLGIIPGQTKVGQLEEFLVHYGLFPSISEGRVYFIGHYVKNKIPPHTQFFVENDLVANMEIDINQSNEFEWSLYAPAATLEQIGAPSRVTFALSTIHEPTPTPLKGWYTMTFFYDEIDVIVQYIDAETKLGEHVTVCPNKDSFDGARIWLGKFQDDSSVPSPDSFLEDVTSFTPSSFRDFVLLEPSTCFDLEASTIPIY